MRYSVVAVQRSREAEANRTGTAGCQNKRRTLRRFPPFPAVTAAERAAYRREIQKFYYVQYASL